MEAWESIVGQGLKRMQRNHIHFASGLPGKDGVISGMRKSCQVYIYLNAKKCAEDGIVFFRSDNGVLLTAGINDSGTLPVCYFFYVTDVHGTVLLDQR
jgi:2'-phosphotransferase